MAPDPVWPAGGRAGSPPLASRTRAIRSLSTRSKCTAAVETLPLRPRRCGGGGGVRSTAGGVPDSHRPGRPNPLKIQRPSGDVATLETPPVWPQGQGSSAPLSASQTRTVPSSTRHAGAVGGNTATLAAGVGGGGGGGPPGGPPGGGGPGPAGAGGGGGGTRPPADPRGGGGGRGGEPGGSAPPSGNGGGRSERSQGTPGDRRSLSARHDSSRVDSRPGAGQAQGGPSAGQPPGGRRSKWSGRGRN